MLKPLTVWITTNCGNSSRDGNTCLLRNLYAGQEATVRTGHGTMTGSKLGREYFKAVYCYPAYLTYMQSTSCEMPGWMKHKLESRLQGEISITSDMQMIPPLWQKVQSLSCVWLIATHGLQHTRLSCLSPSPGACWNSCPLSRWCHPTISSSVLSSLCLQSFPASGSFLVTPLFTLGGQSTGASASASVLQWIFRTDFL